LQGVLQVLSEQREEGDMGMRIDHTGSWVPGLSEADLTIGHIYTRRQIHEALGGAVQEYLPHVDNKVVCGCFTKDSNPRAPDVILPGSGPNMQRWARVFAAQPHAIPIFIKVGQGKWEYVGRYRVKRLSESSSDIQHYLVGASRADVPFVLFLVKTR
jgi:hypothetical protein